MTKEIFLILFDVFSVVFLFVWMIVFFALIVQYILNFFGGKYAIPFLPSPPKVVDKMLEIGKVKAGERVLDLGSGTGSIVIRAARKMDVEATGVEINPFLHFLAAIFSAVTKKKGLVKLIHGSMLDIDLSEYDVLLLFLTASFMEKFLVKKLEKELKRGTRVVSYAFRIKSKEFREEKFEKGVRGFGRYIYLYTRK